MSACEKCWEEASRRAFFKGGNVAEHYRHVLVENDDAGHELTGEQS